YAPAAREQAFLPLPHFSGKAYQLGKAFPDPKLGYVQLTRMGGHPGRETAVVVRWRSPIDGVVRIQGRLIHESSKGDGVRARTIHQGNVVTSWQARASEVATPLPPRKVQRGDVIDFVVDCGPAGSSNSDSYQWNQIVRVVKSDTPHYEAGYQWNARTGFAGPAQPKLERWDLIAQAILVSNEFFFVD
ncbi:MAG: hypothetical protein AAFU85_33450, partial [Planctomycetota bacterium]